MLVISSLLTPANICLQVIDVQEKLMAKIENAERMISIVELMLQCAQIFKIPVLANTQYRKGLGPYLANLEPLIAGQECIDKVEFNAVANKATEQFITALPKRVSTMVLVGVETHICIYQTARGLVDKGLRVWIVEDGVSARKLNDHEAGLRRLQNLDGVSVGPAEMLIYELLGKAGTAEFKQILPLIVNRGE